MAPALEKLSDALSSTEGSCQPSSVPAHLPTFSQCALGERYDSII